MKISGWRMRGLAWAVVMLGPVSWGLCNETAGAASNEPTNAAGRTGD